ncbi:MAG: hypothetical protein K5929_08745, partial [Lachnospiraceae bacterium]|nr:hypothetical protein [Lachnospiraceae bacterium]
MYHKTHENATKNSKNKPRTFIHETDEKAFTDYIQNEGTLQDHILQFSTEEGRRKTVNGAVFNDFHKYLFDNDFWPYNMQNDTLFMLLYDCGGRDKYIDAGLDDIFRRLSDNPPKGRVAQNEFLDTVLNNLQRFAPFDEGVRKLCDFVEFAIETNTREIQK